MDWPIPTHGWAFAAASLRQHWHALPKTHTLAGQATSRDKVPGRGYSTRIYNLQQIKKQHTNRVCAEECPTLAYPCRSNIRARCEALRATSPAGLVAGWNRQGIEVYLWLFFLNSRHPCGCLYTECKLTSCFCSPSTSCKLRE